MKFYEFILFALFDLFIHNFMVKLEIRQNIELFKDLEVPRRWRKNGKNKK